ncbi:uncharacterized protein LOC125760757 isoform X2 [Anopheles funestus]|uniref:uncharacterized protein LOC125760757 precursor n=1 Tax=Anopheles funestus TaxID=62324 RepID=UPI0020C5D621|nr:uncharacterized protein LOC125760757 precursor [Anopheles funestus]
MVGSVFKSGNYFLVGLFGALLIGTVLGSPLPQPISINEPSDSVRITTTERMSTSGSTTTERMITSSTTTTEYPYNAIAKIYSSPQSKVGTTKYASGVHKFDVGHNEDYNKRALEEYNYHFARREMNLPSRMSTSSSTTTERMVTSSTTTTEHPYNAIAKIYSSPQSKVGTIKYASGVHKFDVGHNEDYNKRALEEYNYHFARREMNLPPTTKRYNFTPPNNY